MTECKSSSICDITSKIKDILKNYCRYRYNFISIVCLKDMLIRLIPYFEDFSWSFIEFDNEYDGEYIMSVSKDKQLTIEKALDGDQYKIIEGASMVWVNGDCSSKILDYVKGFRVEWNV